LFDKVRRTKNRKRVELASVHKFAQNQPGLDGLADANIVGDEQAGDGKTQCHQQRHQLVDPGIKTDLGGRAERSGTAAQGEAQGPRQQCSIGLHCHLGVDRHVKSGRLNGRQFQRRIQQHDIVFRTG
jgi:hypothetical protein